MVARRTAGARLSPDSKDEAILVERTWQADGEVCRNLRDLAASIVVEASRGLVFVDSGVFARPSSWETSQRTGDMAMRVEIAGALSCGKSTLASILETMGHRLVYEDLSTNPYLNLRLEDPERYDYLCQQQFVLDKIASLTAASARGEPFVADYSLAAERAYVAHYNSARPDRVAALYALMDRAETGLGLPDAVILLRCAPDEQLCRIRARGRDFEQGHDVAFIARINALVEEQVAAQAAKGVPVFPYRTDLRSWSCILDELREGPLAAMAPHHDAAAA
jgi:deoxyadenosine/deoxycytidine kinase